MLFPLVEPSSFHELRAVISLVDYLLHSDLSMWAVPRRTIFWSSVSWDLGKCRFKYPSWQAWEHKWRLLKTPQSRKERKYTWQKNARISCSRNDCKYTWEKTARISCHNFETNGRPYHFAGVRFTFGRFQHIIRETLNIHDLVVGHWTLCDAKTNWNHENICSFGNFALKPLEIGEIMSNNEIMEFSYFYWKTNEKKRRRENDLISWWNLPWLRYWVMLLEKCIMGYYSIVVWVSSNSCAC